MRIASMCEFTIFLIIAGCCCLMEVADGASEFRRCYNVSEYTHCFDVQYDTTNNQTLTMSFEDARQQCKNLQSTLIIIKNEETNEKLQEFMKEENNPIRSNDVWIDAYRFNDFNVTNRWQWLNKALPNLSASDVTFPYGPDSTRYVAALEFNGYSFRLRAQHPLWGNSFVCEYPVSTCSSVDSSNVRQFDGKCYTAVNESVNWYEARNICLRRGGDLASFANVTSINFSSWLVANSTIRHWIGLRFGGYIWKDTGEDVKFAKWIYDNDLDPLCLAVCPTCYPSFSWHAKYCNITNSIHVVCHTATSLTPTTSTTSAIMQSTRSAADSTSAGTFRAAKDIGQSSSDCTSVGIGLGVGLGVPFVIVTVLVIILAVKYKRLAMLLEQRPRNDNNELGAVPEPSAGQVNDSANDQYQQLNRNLDNSSGTMYDKLRVEPEQNYEEVSSNRT